MNCVYGVQVFGLLRFEYKIGCKCVYFGGCEYENEEDFDLFGGMRNIGGFCSMVMVRVGG